MKPAFPALDPGPRVAAYLVRRFPRRLFRHLKMEQDKYVQDALVLRTTLADSGYPETGPGLQLGPLDENVLREMIAHPEGLPENVYRRRLERGDVCYVLKAQGVLASYNWVSLSKCGTYCGFDKEVLFRDLTDIQTFTYDFYTYKAWRNRGYGLLLKKHLLADLYRLGRRELMNCVEPTNDISLKIHLKLNYRLDSVVTNMRLMKWGWSVHSSPRRTALVEQWLDDCRAFYHL